MLKQGRSADAAALLAPAVAAHRGAEAPDPTVAYVLGMAGQAALAAGAAADAVDLFTEALRLYPPGPAALEVAQARLGLARARHALGDPASARPLADAAGREIDGLDPAEAAPLRADLDLLLAALAASARAPTSSPSRAPRP